MQKPYLEGTTPSTGEFGYWQLINIPALNYIMEDNGDGTALISFNAYPECVEVDFEYTLSNGGCSDHDTITVYFQLGDENPQIVSPLEDEAYCTANMEFTGTHLGCDGNYTPYIIESPIASSPVIQKLAENTINFSCTFDVSGWYTVATDVDLTSPL